ncbi:SHOCT domain-containing protein [Dyadobacter flavalbus]|uniref:SHOCT domain-containing protein n=1 Tax=Dyadobacter flavalbus TaxID=2579942 RepID=A0A5M8R1M8_9BACT|nr:SHOCT domain-containing protein [Dyadobacter flavalbus]KAA6440633.1 SHOCT domain-containing protein [Dyadobacter flavalbus]
MKALTNEGQQIVEDIAAKYNLQTATVESLLNAVISGNGTMAQFNIPELGGSGQWMKGGMTMVGDMFNNSARTTVDKLCSELSNLVSTRLLFEETSEIPEKKPQVSSRYSAGSGSSWPSIFGNPTASGSQNNFRYAYFARVKRLVIEENGKQTIYDTKHHEITGISQQQGSGSLYKFTSQDGPVDLSSLTIISEPSAQMQPTPEIAYDVTSTADLSTENHGHSPQDIIISTIEKVNMLFEKGQITEEEFKAKKEELLSKL